MLEVHAIGCTNVSVLRYNMSVINPSSVKAESVVDITCLCRIPCVTVG